MENETSIRLIELYGSLNELWNPRHKDYFNKNIREGLWDKIAQNFELPKKELKAKMKSLLSSYRREKNREKESTVAGSGRNQSYKSKWFAYEAFNFLRDKNNHIDTSDTITDMALLNQPTTHYHEERRPGYSTAQQLTDLSDSLASNSTDNGSGVTQLIRNLDA